MVLTRWRKKAQGKDVLGHLSQQYKQKFMLAIALPRKGRTESPGALYGRKMSLPQSEEC